MYHVLRREPLARGGQVGYMVRYGLCSACLALTGGARFDASHRRLIRMARVATFVKNK